MTDRLAEIAARAAELMTHFGPDDKGKGGGDVDDLVARVCDDDVPLLIARVRALEAQAAIGRLAEEYVLAVHAEHEVETLGLDQEAFGAEWERRWDVADAVYVRLREAVDAARAARKEE